jgi:hypothetical protein
MVLIALLTHLLERCSVFKAEVLRVIRVPRKCGVSSLSCFLLGVHVALDFHIDHSVLVIRLVGEPIFINTIFFEICIGYSIKPQASVVAQVNKPHFDNVEEVFTLLHVKSEVTASFKG